jgi:hypothetical protein
MRAAARAALFFASCCAAGARTLLLLSPDALSSVTNVSVAPGEPALLASYLGGIGGGQGVYAGWAYPAVVRGPLSNGSDGFLMLYSACACASAGCFGREPMYTFLAESADGVSWSPVSVPSSPPGAPPGALFASGEVGAVMDDAGGSGVGAGERYKLLRADTTIEVSDDARTWARWRYNWTAQPVDPGFHALRPVRGGAAVVITARPQLLRPEGRHAGTIAAADGWAGLGAQLAAATQPLDGLIYRWTDEVYGLPAFDYAAVLAADPALPPALTRDADGGNFVAFAWRLLAANSETGWVTSALAFSRDARSWAPAPSAPANVSLLAADTDLPGATYARIYGAWPSPEAGAAACDAACRNDSSSCAAWAYVAPAAARGPERCCLKRDLSAPAPASGVVSGARSDLGARGSAPLPALPALFALPTAPSAIAYRQFYPKTVVAVGGRMLVYASVSSAMHGDSAPNASGIEVYALRADGFAAATGPPAGAGAVVSAQLAWASGEAALNVLCGGGGGGVRVAVLRGGAPLAGYALADADPAPPSCDNLVWAPSWGGGARGLAALAGMTLQLQVELSNGAKLFALRGDFTLTARGVAA